MAVHADINDEGQTVKLVELPKEEPKNPAPEPEQPTPETPTKATYTPKTSDALAPEVLAVVALAACLALGIALHARRRACRKATEGLLSDGEDKDEETPSYWRSLYQEK